MEWKQTDSLIFDFDTHSVLFLFLQWPKEEDLPGFKATFLRYLKAVEDLSNEFTELVAEALGLPSDGLAQFYGSRDRIQHRSKVRAHAPRVLNQSCTHYMSIPSPLPL